MGGTPGAAAAWRTMLGCVMAVAVSHALAQSTGTLRLFVDPGGNFEFVVDGKYRMKQREVTLIEGPHRLQVWAPTCSIVDTTITIRPGQQDLILRLPVSREYADHIQTMRRFREGRLLKRNLPLAVSLGTGIWAGVSFANYRNAYRTLRDDEDRYRTSAIPSELARLKEVEIPAHKDELRRTRTLFAVSASTFVLAAAATTWAYIRTGRDAVPVFHDAEKVRFDGLVWVPGPQGGTWAFGATIPLR